MQDEQQIKAMLRKVHVRMQDRLIAQHGKGYTRSFNEWLGVDEIMTIYVRKSERSAPHDLYAAI